MSPDNAHNLRHSQNDFELLQIQIAGENDVLNITNNELILLEKLGST